MGACPYTSRKPRAVADVLAGDDAAGRWTAPDARDRFLDRRRHAHRGRGGDSEARNIAADGRCVIATGSTTLPSLDIVIEGHADAITDADEVRHVAEAFREKGWQLEATGDQVDGPNAPTAGPPPYTIFRIVPWRVFGLPGMTGMEQFDPGDLPKPTRWDFDGS